MLKTRVIPILLYDGSYCVQTTKFARPARRLGPMAQYVNNMADRNIDELVILDIDATKANRGPSFKKIKSYTEKLFCPVAYGGGIRNENDVTMLIQECGIDKVIIKSNFHCINVLSRRFGAQSIVYAMDCYPHHSNGMYFVHNIPKKLSPIRWAKMIQNEGAGEIILTHTYRQGMMNGYSTNLIAMISNEVTIPVVANGGCGEPEHMIVAIKAGANAVAASSMFMLRDYSPMDCSAHLQRAGVETRVESR